MLCLRDSLLIADSGTQRTDGIAHRLFDYRLGIILQLRCGESGALSGVLVLVGPMGVNNCLDGGIVRVGLTKFRAGSF